MDDKVKKQEITKEVRRISGEAWMLAGKIGELAEPGFREHQSSKLIADFLERHGFDSVFSFKDMPTAFRASAGAGEPHIGILGEYDALPDCGAQAGENGHGCGHNLLGAGSAAGAVAAASLLARKKLKGTIVYYGCPAEELLAGKAYMARDGAFRDLDACIAWHPSANTGASYHGGAALDSVVYEFFGKTAHGSYPAGSKSALDAAILFDIAVNYLRESIPDNVRIHSVIKNGGDAPNVVPAYARIWYYIRGRDREQVDEMHKLVDDCARGASIATQTTFNASTVTAIHNRLPNDAMFDIMNDNIRLFGPPRSMAADKKNARELGLEGDFNTGINFNDKEQGRPSFGSSDEDTVSRLVPLGKIRMTTFARGTSGHHRQEAAQTMLPFARRGMLNAGKAIAGAAVDLVSKPRLMAGVRSEFRNRTEDLQFDPLIPEEQEIPLLINGETG